MYIIYNYVYHIEVSFENDSKSSFQDLQCYNL